VRAAGARVLELTGGTSTLRGLAVGGANVGVQISGGSGHVLAGDRLGTDPTGTASSASGSGVAIADADGVTVEDSVVGGRLGVVSGPTAGQTTVRSTSIGLDAEGAAVLGDVEAGVFVGGTDAVVEGNRTWGTRGGIFVIGSGATDAQVVGNRVGVTAAGAPIEGSGSAIRVDAAPGSTVADNVVWGGGAGAVLVSGSAQYEIVEGDDGQEIVFDAPTSEPHDEGATGGSATIVGNVIGVASPGAEIGSGLIAWAGASDLVVRGNTVRGASGAAVQLVGGARHRLASNVLGEAGAPVAEGVSAIAAADVTVGGAGAGNTVAASTTGVRLEGATGSARIEATTISLGDGGSGIEVTGGAATTVVGNSVTGADQGILAVGEGASVTGNAIDDGGTGITVTGRGSAVQGNVVAGQAEVGIASTGDGSNVSTNSVVRSGLGLRLAGAEVEVEANRVGLSETGAEEGNLGVGIVVAGGAAVLDRNQVAGSTGVGIEVSPAARAELRSNRIWGSSSGRGIQAPGAPAAPQLVAAVRTGSGTTLRRTLVVAGLPAGDAGRIEVFANDSCADPEARYLLDIVRPKASDETFRVVQVRERPTRDHFTVTYTDATGATSELSDCTSGATYPDADGDGSVDPLDGLLDPSGPSDATRAIVATDEEQLLLLGVAPLDPETGEGGGELEAVAITEDPAPNAHPEGWDLPYGALRFRISGLEPGARTNVTMTAIFGSSPIQGTSYWKYAPPAPGEASSWFDFAFDEASGTGAQLSSATEVPGVGIRRAFVLWLADGRRGDVDGGANGTITDPGGPVVFDGTVEPPGSTTTTSTPSSTTSTSTSTLAAAPTSSVPGGGAGAPAVGAGDLARTGAPLAWLLRLAGTALGIGALAWSVGRSRRSEAARAG
ncbi:MAG TPA: right-handed parallel beta-helix repeat-containing protein, partial [Aquihabitans sp.]|nr:right-handed parallel beta-helix repeat-containing protein [Aquihabitans sp.]